MSKSAENANKPKPRWVERVRRSGPTSILLALGAACAYQTEAPGDYGGEPTLGTGAALGTTSDDEATSSDSTTSMGGSASVVTVTIGSSSTSDTSGDTTDTTSASAVGSTSSGVGGSSTTSTTSATDMTTGSGGMTSTTTVGEASGTMGGMTSGGMTSGGMTSGGMTSGGFGGSTSGGATSGTGGMMSTSTFRYARLVALTSQNGNPYASTGELQLLGANGQPLNGSGWTASADSEETVDETAPASRAIDGDTQTYWHTEWGDYEAPLPHYLQIDMGSAQEVTGFVYTPRQGGNDNGWILAWEFYLSNSASSPGTPVASGSFASGASAQTINLP